MNLVWAPISPEEVIRIRLYGFHGVYRNLKDSSKTLLDSTAETEIVFSLFLCEIECQRECEQCVTGLAAEWPSSRVQGL